MVNAHLAENSCMNVVRMDRLLYRFEAEIVRGAVGYASFDAASGKQD